MSFPPQPQWQAITPGDARDLFRHAFGRWGLPWRDRVNNGHPWGLNSGLPPDLALWLIGLGVEMALESAAPAAAQQQGRALQRRDPAMGRAVGLPDAGPSCRCSWTGRA